jgi:AhpD family alkylhydroperoxidase
MTFRNFPALDETNAPLEAREALADSRRAFGALPAPLACYASAPALLSVALSGLRAFENTSLSALEREVLAMTMGRRSGCRFCLRLHRRALMAQEAPPELIEALEAGRPLTNRKLEALRSFVIALLDHSGDVPPEVWSDFRQAGFDHRQALELVLGVGLYTVTTFANRLTETSE